MYKIDFSKPIHIHFIGIGGISMSGLAEILKDAGFRVSGSDRSKSPLTETLERKGINVFYGQRAGNITDDIDLVVILLPFTNLTKNLLLQRIKESL